MPLTKPKVKIESSKTSPEVYPTWDAFVQAKVSQANQLLSQMDQGTLLQLIASKKQNNTENEPVE